MPKDFLRYYVYPIATLTGSIIGVGFLSLPYLALKVGIWVTLLYFATFVPVVVITHVIFGQICLKTPDFKRWPGFIRFYFGKKMEQVMTVVMIGGSFGVLLAYLIIGSQFLNVIFSPMLGGDQFMYAVIYFLVLSLAIYYDAKAIAKLELMAVILLLISFCLIFFKGFSYIQATNFLIQPKLNFGNLFLPYGAVLFSLWGTALIPEAEEMIPRRKDLLRIIIVCSILISAIIYLLFIFLVLGVSGHQTTESALIGLGNILGSGFTIPILLIGIITTFAAFLAGGLFLKKVFIYDLGFSKNLSWLIVCLVPLILFLLGFRSFIPLLSFVGGFLLSLDGIFILLMYRKIGGKKIISYPLMIIFALGMIYSFAAYLF